MPGSGYSIEDVPLKSCQIQDLYEGWRYPDIVENANEEQIHSVIDEEGQVHFGLFVQHRPLTEPRYQTEYKLGQYRDSIDLFQTLFQKLETQLPDIASTKEKIAFAKLVFGDEITSPSNSIFGLATQIDSEYANQFKYDPETQIVAPRDQVPRSLRQELIEEYGGCARCDSEKNLHIHHIVPYARGGPTGRNNLVPLCRPCHTEAHEPSYDYESIVSFFEWISNGP